MDDEKNEPESNGIDVPINVVDVPITEDTTINKPKSKPRKPRRKKEVPIQSKQDRLLENGNSRSASPASSLVKERIYSKPGRTNNTKNTEKLPSIEDAVCIYASLRNDGTRPVTRTYHFLEYSTSFSRTLVFVKLLCTAIDVDKIASELSAQAVEGEEMEFAITNIQNISTGTIPDKAEIKVKVYMQKKCFKRRKTDVTVKEREVYSVTLRPPVYFNKYRFTINTQEMKSDIHGAYHLSASYLRVKIMSTYVQRTRAVSSYSYRKGVKRRAVDSEHIYKTNQYSASLLLHTAGSTNLMEGSHTLYLQLGDGAQSVPQCLDWNGLSASTLMEMEVHRKIFTKRSLRPSTKLSLSPSKALTTAATAPPSKVVTAAEAPPAQPSQPSQPEPQSSSEIPAPSVTTQGDGKILTGSLEKNKVYMVMLHKGAPRTTVQTGYNCPFCLRKTRPPCLEFLLKHLRLCHDRLLFLYKEGDDSISVTVNAFSDGSYAGNPIDVIPGLFGSKTKTAAEERREPRRRKSFTEIINLHCSRKPVTLDEFTRPEPLSAASSSTPTGHNRLYYHSMSNSAMLSNDFEYDSDGDDEDWKKIASIRLIDDFIDVNRGEKDMMKLWNQFMTHNSNIISDRQMESACRQFLQLHMDVIACKLRNNFLCHLATLYDCGCLSASQLANIIRELPNKRATTNGYHLKEK